MEQDMYMKILSLLKEHYDKDPLYFVTSSDLRAKLGVGSVDDIRPYAENLEINRYVYKQEGFFSGMGTNFLLKIRHMGIDALKAGAVEINKECKLHGPEKLKSSSSLTRRTTMSERGTSSRPPALTNTIQHSSPTRWSIVGSRSVWRRPILRLR